MTDDLTAKAMEFFGSNIADLQALLLKEKQHFENRSELVRGAPLDKSDVDVFLRMYRLTAGYVVLVETLPGGTEMPELNEIYQVAKNNLKMLEEIATHYMAQSQIT